MKKRRSVASTIITITMLSLLSFGCGAGETMEGSGRGTSQQKEAEIADQGVEKEEAKESSISSLYMDTVESFPDDICFTFVYQDLEYPVLLVTDNTYDNRDGRRAALQAEAYYYNGAGVVCVGTFESDGTAYPLEATGTSIFCGNGHAWYEWRYSKRTGQYEMESAVEDDIARGEVGAGCYRYRNNIWQKVVFSEFNSYRSINSNQENILSFQSKKDFMENNPYTG